VPEEANVQPARKTSNKEMGTRTRFWTGICEATRLCGWSGTRSDCVLAGAHLVGGNPKIMRLPMMRLFWLLTATYAKRCCKVKVRSAAIGRGGWLPYWESNHGARARGPTPTPAAMPSTSAGKRLRRWVSGLPPPCSGDRPCDQP
jgi:hypothetical protein